MAAHKMKGHYYSHNRGGGIEMDGVDYGAPFKAIHTAGNYQVWYKKSSTVYCDRGTGNVTAPALYLLVRVEGKQHEVIREEEPGYKWHKVKAELIAKCDELAKGE